MTHRTTSPAPPRNTKIDTPTTNACSVSPVESVTTHGAEGVPQEAEEIVPVVVVVVGAVVDVVVVGAVVDVVVVLAVVVVVVGGGCPGSAGHPEPDAAVVVQLVPATCAEPFN